MSFTWLASLFFDLLASLSPGKDFSSKVLEIQHQHEKMSCLDQPWWVGSKTENREYRIMTRPHEYGSLLRLSSIHPNAELVQHGRLQVLCCSERHQTPACLQTDTLIVHKLYEKHSTLVLCLSHTPDRSWNYQQECAICPLAYRKFVQQLLVVGWCRNWSSSGGVKGFVPQSSSWAYWRVKKQRCHWQRHE